jgi:hypothetical protein
MYTHSVFSLIQSETLKNLEHIIYPTYMLMSHSSIPPSIQNIKHRYKDHKNNV